LQTGAGIFAQELDNSKTDIYKIDLKSGIKTRVAIPEGDHNIDNVIVSEDGRYLYFSSQTDGRLYKINLK
jgi:Tol biopolymer transport system component